MNIIRLRKKTLLGASEGASVIILNTSEEHRVGPDPEADWKEWGMANAGRRCILCSSPWEAKEVLEEFRRGAIGPDAWYNHGVMHHPDGYKRKTPTPLEVMEAYANPVRDLPDDPPGAAEWSPGEHVVRLTKRVLMSMPTGARICSSVLIGLAGEPCMDEAVPVMGVRHALWLEIKRLRLDGRNASVIVQ